MKKITPFLWFDGNAEEAMELYVATIPGASVDGVVRYTEVGPGPAGSVMTATFSAGGQQFTLINGGPQFKFTEAVSFVLHCESQAEIDRLWDGLTANGGKPGRCGWLKDRFGVSWQVVPSNIGQMASNAKVMAEVMKMTKIDLATIERAMRE